MDKNSMKEISVGYMQRTYQGSYIENDIFIFDEVNSTSFPQGPWKTKCILLALCLKGSVRYTVDTIDYTVRANDIFIVSEGQVVNNYEPDSDLSAFGIFISEDFFQEIVRGIHELSSLFIFSRVHPVYSLSESESENLKLYLRALKLKLDEREHHFRRDVARSLMMTMIYDLSNVILREQYDNRKTTRAEVIFAQFIDMVEKNFRKERRVGWYAFQLTITPKYLSETVKIVSHRTPNEWIDYYVIHELRILLKTSGMNIKEITDYLNFPNQSFLGKFFKEHVGMSPSEYRKN